MSGELVRVVAEQRRCALYRHYDGRDVLLYVGISETPVDRTNGHARTSEWVQYAERAEAQWLGTRLLAERAERYAIQDEEPVFNRVHALGDVDQRIADYLTDREFQNLRDTLESYERMVGQFLDGLPAETRKEAEEKAQHDYDRAGDAVDKSFPAHVLRHVGRLLETWAADAPYVGEEYAYGKIIELVDAQMKRIRDRRAAERVALDPWAAAVGSDDEPPF